MTGIRCNLEEVSWVGRGILQNARVTIVSEDLLAIYSISAL